VRSRADRLAQAVTGYPVNATRRTGSPAGSLAFIIWLPDFPQRSCSPRWSRTDCEQTVQLHRYRKVLATEPVNAGDLLVC
jgi:hypothetical protein